MADVKQPANDNLPVANDNRAKYMRDYMKRRRQGRKTLKDLLKEGLEVIEACDTHADAAWAFIIAARERLDGPQKRKRRKEMRT